jgi:GNAT superfamily N-acetyltransferase
MTPPIIIQRYAAGDPLPPGPPEAFADPWSQHPESHLRAIDASGAVMACCSLWHSETPILEGKRIGYVGHYWASSAGASRELLSAVCADLLALGRDVAVGPLDGNTWRRYRLVTDAGAEPGFFMEPLNPPEWPAWWMEAGFAALAGYHSSLNDQLIGDDDGLQRSGARAAAAGLKLRSIDMGTFDAELQAIHRLSCEAFPGNFLYSPIAWPEFAAMYRPLHAMINPSFVLLADDPHRRGEIAGFLLALPDMLEQRKTGRARTLILKSMAVHPAWRSVGLGGWLIAQAQANASTAGMTRSIFALMHDDNHSARIGSRYGRVIRRYTLFSRSLR